MVVLQTRCDYDWFDKLDHITQHNLTMQYSGKCETLYIPKSKPTPELTPVSRLTSTTTTYATRTMFIVYRSEHMRLRHMNWFPALEHSSETSVQPDQIYAEVGHSFGLPWTVIIGTSGTWPRQAWCCVYLYHHSSTHNAAHKKPRASVSWVSELTGGGMMGGYWDEWNDR